jgi:2-keto-4-pentenoate hydratase/2-oxohepta-3-ene-1,7-dioic acid hydratase in catechol pathway
MSEARRYAQVQLSDGTPHVGEYDDDGSVQVDGTRHPRGTYRLLPPVSPSKLVCVGFNYKAHAGEMSQKVPDDPLLFLKPPSAVIADGQPVVRPGEARVDYEGELAVVIGRRARNVLRSAALDFVEGLTIANDVTAREFQLPGSQWTRAKCQDTFAPIGPCILESTEWAGRLIETRLNGTVVQSASTDLLVFDVPTLIAHASALMTLEPGDVILTGTPSGVGPMRDGDVVQVSIEGIGTLSNPVMSEILSWSPHDNLASTKETLNERKMKP